MQVDWTGQGPSGTSSEDGMYHIPWMSIGQVDWKDSGTTVVSEGGMSNRRPVDVHWIGGLDGTVGQAGQ